MGSPFCLWILRPFNFRVAESIFMKFGYVYHGTLPHLNGVLHKSLQPVCVPVCISQEIVISKHQQKYTRDQIVKQGNFIVYITRVCLVQLRQSLCDGTK
jgi:hypothetical protein